MSLGDDPDESRAAQRYAGNIGATILLPNGERIGCVVKDFSATGASLVVTGPVDIPQEFELKAHNGPTRHVEVVRRRAGTIAVRFSVLQTTAPPAGS